MVGGGRDPNATPTRSQVGSCVRRRATVAAVNDPLAPLAELPGVADASERVREALGKAHRHRVNLRGWPATAAEAAVRAAQASSVLDRGAPRFPADGLVSGPILAGALRVAEALEGGQTALVGVWQRAPLQALARLHALAAADLVEADALGRPRVQDDVANRLDRAGRPADRRQRRAGAGAGGGRARRDADAGAVRQRRRRGGQGGVAAGDPGERPGPARPRRAGGLLDAPCGRVPRRRPQIRHRHG